MPRDPFTLRPADLMNLTVDITIVAGRVVYERRSSRNRQQRQPPTSVPADGREDQRFERGSLRQARPGRMGHAESTPRNSTPTTWRSRDALFQILTAIHDDRDVRAMVLPRRWPGLLDRRRPGRIRDGAVAHRRAMGPISPRCVGDAPRAAHSRPSLLSTATRSAADSRWRLLCDLAIAADDTRLSLPETGAGMIPGVAGTQTAARRLGLGRALDLCLTGRWIDAQDALLVGMVAEVVPLADLDRRALTIPPARSPESAASALRF